MSEQDMFNRGASDDGSGSGEDDDRLTQDTPSQSSEPASSQTQDILVQSSSQPTALTPERETSPTTSDVPPPLSSHSRAPSFE